MTEKKRDAGFTLLEVLAAFAILGAGILVVIRLFMSGTWFAASLEDTTGLVLAAREKMDEALASRHLEEGVTKGVDSGGRGWEVRITPENGKDMVLKLDVTVEKGNRSFTLTTLKNRLAKEQR